VKLALTWVMFVATFWVAGLLLPPMPLLGLLAAAACFAGLVRYADLGALLRDHHRASLSVALMILPAPGIWSGCHVQPPVPPSDAGDSGAGGAPVTQDAGGVAGAAPQRDAAPAAPVGELCRQACANLVPMQCTWAMPTAAGATCERVCADQWVYEGQPLDCYAHAPSCAVAKSCKGK
jgi:hypothetical protein